MKTTFILCLLLLFLSCCKEENLEVIIPNPSDCAELGTTPLQGWTYLVDTNYYMYPSFNPNNSDEIIFTKKNNATEVTRLFKYNLLTHEKTLLHVGYQIFPSDWGSNDWILLNLLGNSVWKIKSDGTGLTQLTNTGNDFYPIWRSDCMMYSAFRGSFVDNLQKTILYTIESIPFDTLQNIGLASNAKWRSDGLSCVMGDYGPKVFDVTNDTVIFSDFGEYEYSGGTTWLSDFEFIWSCESGLYKTNYSTGEKILVKESCRNRMYKSPTYAPSINKIIWTRVDLKQLNNFDVEVKSRLFMMNPDGSEETEIIIE